LNVQLAVAQISDNAYAAIIKVLNSADIAEKIYVVYTGNTIGVGSFELGPGTYAFICPNTEFANSYVGIRKMLPHTMSTDTLLQTKKFFKDRDRAIYVRSSAAFELFIAFTKLNINDGQAEVTFFTTSLQEEPAYKGKYVRVSAKLLKKDDIWIVVESNVEPIEWINYFGFDVQRK
jgi:hypothetical protein